MQRSGAASSGPIAEAATTLTADDILLLADGPAGPHWVEPPVLGEDGKVLFRRLSLVVARSRDGLLSEPTAVAQPGRREPSFVPHTRRSQNPSRPAQSGGKATFEDRTTFGLVDTLTRINAI
jgi:hypothetical protein